MESQGSLKTMEEGGRRIGEGGVRTDARCERKRERGRDPKRPLVPPQSQVPGSFVGSWVFAS